MFRSDIIQTMKCFALESFNLICQAEHTKINSRLNFKPGLALIAFWTTRPSSIPNFLDISICIWSSEHCLRSTPRLESLQNARRRSHFGRYRSKSARISPPRATNFPHWHAVLRLMVSMDVQSSTCTKIKLYCYESVRVKELCKS